MDYLRAGVLGYTTERLSQVTDVIHLCFGSVSSWFPVVFRSGQVFYKVGLGINMRQFYVLSVIVWGQKGKNEKIGKNFFFVE